MKTKDIQELYQIKLHSMDVMMPVMDGLEATKRAIINNVLDMARIEILEGRNILLAEDNDLNADKHSPASSARSTKRRVRGNAYVSGS